MAPDGTKALLYAALFMLSSMASTLSMKKVTNVLPNYSFFVSLAHITVLTGAFFACAPAAPGAAALAIRTRTFALLGALDALAGVLVLLGSVHTSGPTQQLLMQCSIPLTMLGSAALFGKRYGARHLAGAALILAGVGITLAPKLLADSAAAASGGGGSGKSGSGGSELIFNGIFALSVVPMVGATLYKEAALTATDGNGGDVDGNYLNAWIGVFQMGFTLLCLPLNALPVLGPGAVPLAELGAQLAAGAACVLGGVDSVTPATHPGCVRALAPGALACDACAGAWWPLAQYLVFNFAMNAFLTDLLKHAGATTMFAVTTARMPLQAIAFSLPLLMGEAARPFTQTDIASLAVIVAGILVYKSAGAALPATKAKAE